MIREFRDFLARGNVIDLAVGLIAGIVFGALVNSLVSDVLMQVVAAVVGKPNFSGLSFDLLDTPIRYGSFLTALLNFVLTMGAVFFFIVKPLNAVTERIAQPEPEGRPTNRECPECLAEVPVAARRCRFCTSEITPIAS
ncbi:MAG: mscL [Thermoleophilia bacterium]|jgi:large conductance mechanosensitive channel|nr:mscL [Thermoleophilia bacterium]